MVNYCKEIAETSHFLVSIDEASPDARVCSALPRREKRVRSPQEPISNKTGPFMQGEIETDEMAREFRLVGLARLVGDRPWDDRPTDRAKDTDRARHMRGGGDEDPILARPRVDEGLAEDCILIGVAGAILED